MAKKIHRTLNNIGLRSTVLTLASCLVLSAVPSTVQAAGLGRIVVFSALGQPLRAEVDLTATREELSGMRAQLASPETFKQAGLDYATTLLSIHFSVDKRADGQPVIRLSSDRPINDPFVDMLLELNWPAGRLVREYTFLLDPPEVAAKGFPPLATATTKSGAVSKPTMAPRTSAPVNEEVRSKALAKVRSRASSDKPVQQPAEGQNLHEVKHGDTLHKIAGETKPEGVSLEQMLVGLFRANQEAFDGGNMNRLKAGKILVVPDKSAVETVSSSEAHKIVVAQASDWNAYRNKLAGAAAKSTPSDEEAKQEATGKISAKVEDKAAPKVEPKDHLKVSRSEAVTTKPDVGTKRSEEDLIAKEKALREANERLAALEKNVADLQKLIELKNQNLAELQAQSTAKAVPAEAKKPAEESKPPTAPPDTATAAAPAKVEPAAPAVEKPVEKPTEKPVDAKPVEPAPAPKPEEPKPQPMPVEKPKPAPAPAPRPEEPGFLDVLLDNPLALAGGGLLALLAGYFVVRRRQASKEEPPLDLTSTLSPQSSSLSLTANSVFRNTGGQSVDTSHTPAQTDFSQAGPGSIDTDEVDPVAEADVYMAYGRDVQAEEILVEAKQKDPKRHAIHLKLLEIYANRKDVKQFEPVATELYGDTGGVGADWEKAAAMGLKLDPSNPLYGSSAAQAAAAPAEAAFDADATVMVTPKLGKNTVTMPGELSQLAEAASAEAAAPALESPAGADLTSLDFDLGLGDVKPSPAGDTAKVAMEETYRLPEPVVDSGALDFDLASDKAATSDTASDAGSTAHGLDFGIPESPTAATADDESGKETVGLDFDLGIESSLAEAASKPAVDSGAEVAPEIPSIDDVNFDVNLTESTFLGSTMPEPSSFDMTSINLDLRAPDLDIQPTAPSPEAAGAAVSSTSLDSADSTLANVLATTAVNPEFESEQSDTVVNPDFETQQFETIVNPQFGTEQDIMPPQDLMPAQDFSTEQVSTVVNPEFDQNSSVGTGQNFAKTQEETIVNPQFGAEADLAPEFDISPNEEVTTKLDLAKAYEEMGDLEGARELLQEVLKEGDAAQREKAQTILNNISE